MTDLNALRQLYGERDIRPGDTVTVEGWSARFAVIDVREDVVLLQTENGMRIQARRDLVELVREAA